MLVSDESSEEEEDSEDSEEEESSEEDTSSEEDSPPGKAQAQSPAPVKASKDKPKKKGSDDLGVKPKDSSLLDLDDCKRGEWLLGIIIFTGATVNLQGQPLVLLQAVRLPWEPVTS